LAQERAGLLLFNLTGEREVVMGKVKIFGTLIRRTEGSVAVIAAIGLVAFLGMVSLAIDMGHIYTTRNELQNVTDAAALAAAGNLIHDSGGVAVRDAAAAQQAALTVAQRQSQLSGQPAVGDGDRNDLSIIFGAWDIYTGNPATAWTEIGSTCSSTSNANAVKITISRASGTVYGPVSNFLGGILGINTSQITTTAIAYLGYTYGVPPSTVPVPVTVPEDVLAASKGRSGWFARMLGPREAVATTTKTYVFKDTGGKLVDNNVTTAPLDTTQAYLFTVGKTDAVPGTIWDILTKVYTPSYTSSNPVYVADLKVGQEIHTRSEFKYGTSYISPIFQRLQKAYNYKTTGNASTAPPAGTAWRVTLPVYGTTPNPAASRQRQGNFVLLARLLAPFWPSEAYACYTMPPPKTYVNGFVNADITNVTYSSTANNGNYTFPKTIGGVTYTNKKDFLTRYPDSVWNLNSVTIKNVTDASTVSPPGSTSGGHSNQVINPGAPGGPGPFADRPVLVK
jgi:Flp pilus assembly protein TadG